jgi:hypothetical protein
MIVSRKKRMQRAMMMRKTPTCQNALRDIFTINSTPFCFSLEVSHYNSSRKGCKGEGRENLPVTYPFSQTSSLTLHYVYVTWIATKSWLIHNNPMPEQQMYQQIYIIR